MAEKHPHLSLKEAHEALRNGKRVQFHWREQTVEISLNTSLDDLRWALMARLKLLVSDVTEGRYSIIN